MTDRAMPTVDRATACPFVAFDDDRDSRADQPDHRHRCFAENPPAPRALAHQDAYCLSPQFPACPAFQDWARREAARARPIGGAVTAAVWTPDEDGAAPLEPGPVTGAGGLGVEPPVPSEAPDSLEPDERLAPDPSEPASRDPWSAADEADALGLPPRRAPRRDWAAPPPWTGAAAAGAAAAGVAAAGSQEEPGTGPTAARPDEAAGLAERHASLERSLRGGPPGSPVERGESPATDAGPTDRPPFLAGRAAAAPPARPDRDRFAELPRDDDGEGWASADEGPGTRRFGSGVARSRVRGAGGDRDALVGPSWERPRRTEAYPTLRTRMGVKMPGTTPLLTAFIVLLIVAAGLFFLPSMVLNLGGTTGTSHSSPTPPGSAAPAASATIAPSPTPTVYVVQKGDTLSRIASKYGVTVADIVAANHLKDANKIGEGDRLTIPTPAPSDLSGASSVPAASP